MPPILSIVGKSDSGKTTLIEKIIPALKQKGYRVGIVKHAHHGFELDQAGKDSWRHQKAGADTVMVASPGQIAMVKRFSSERLDDLAPFFSDMDILISEGFKRDRAPKIEVFRKARHAQPACLTDDMLMAIVSDSPLDVSVPCFALDDVDGIADFIVTRFLTAPQ